MQKIRTIKARCVACNRARSAALNGVFAAAVLVVLVLALGACSLNRDVLASARDDIRTICEDPVTTVLASWCGRVVIPAVPEDVEPK